MEELKNTILNAFDNNAELSKSEFEKMAKELLDKLNSGELRSAEPMEEGNWKVNSWVKKGILLIFKHSNLVDMSINSEFTFFDKNEIPLKPIGLEDKIRMVPGGSSIRTGAYVAPGVICMPPMYINIGSYVDEGSMIDSHALVGTCAQVGKRVHLSAASQIGGVLEPAGARPVIVEDDVMIGGNCGVYEGALIRRRAVLGSGVILTGSTKVYDLVNEKVIAATPDSPLEIPEAAVVIPGSRALNSEFGKSNGLSIASPMIIKYRDEKTDAKTALNETLR
jgi:2,3,4,5-tetrahydropyridine-2-carboxylate N-succinyltransferase